MSSDNAVRLAIERLDEAVQCWATADNEVPVIVRGWVLSAEVIAVETPEGQDGGDWHGTRYTTGEGTSPAHALGIVTGITRRLEAHVADEGEN